MADIVPTHAATESREGMAAVCSEARGKRGVRGVVNGSIEL
jgi:hypothetical protein